MLGGYLVAYLNLDKVIKIIRTEDEPKPVLMKTFKLTDVQADAILNMRLRNLRKLEEMEIRAEDKALREERKKLKSLIGSTEQQWKTIAGQIKEVRETFGPKTALGKRRTDFGEAPAHDEAAIEEAMVVREPITVVVSEKGWIRALRGHVSRSVRRRLQDRRRAEIRVPDRDHRQDSDLRQQRPLLHHRCLEAAGRARPRRAGAAVRRSRAGRRPGGGASPIRAAASSWWRATSGNGFVVPEDEVLGTTRKGKQVLNLKAPDKAAAHDARSTANWSPAIGENRKMVIFGLDQVPEMTRGRGVRLQRYKDRGLSDVTTFKAEDGLTWIDSAGRSFTLSLKELQGLARQSRRRRPHRARRLPHEQQVRHAAGGKSGERREAIAAHAVNVETPLADDALNSPRTPASVRRLRSSAAAVSPKNSFSPGRRPTPITIRLLLARARSP